MDGDTRKLLEGLQQHFAELGRLELGPIDAVLQWGVVARDPFQERPEVAAGRL